MKAWILIAVFALAGFIWQSRSDAPFLPIHYVRIEGSIKNLDDQKFREEIAPSIDGGYFSVDLHKIEAVARRFAWIDAIKVIRYWPDTLVLRVSEHKPIARWGDNALLNQRGELFEPENAKSFANLPLIHGPMGTEMNLLAMVKLLNDRLNDRNMSVVSLELSERRAWVANLSSGMEIHFGRQDPVRALDRFLEFAPKLGEEKMARLKRVDLRYPNGFAVVWKPLDAGKIEGQGAIGINMIGKASQLALEM